MRRAAFLFAMLLGLGALPAAAQVHGGVVAFPLALTAGNCLQALNAYQGKDAGAPCGIGTVSAGTINQLAWYAATGSTVSGLATAASGVLVTSAGGVPSISQTIPAGTQDNITRLGTIASIGAPLGTAFGGTGVANNAASTVTISGNFAATFTLSNTTGVTFPTSGTLATTANLASYLPLAGGTMVGNLLFTDGLYDIGASGATRPRTGYFSTSLVAPTVNATTGFQVAGVALACANLSNGATGCSTATGTSGATIPLLNGTNTWSGAQSFNSGNLIHKGATSGTLTINAAATAGSGTLTFPAGTTDFSATGGTGQFVKQASSGSAFTVAAPTISEIAGLGANVATFLATPSSANLSAAIADGTGTGIAVFNTGPTFAGTPTLGTGAAASALIWKVNGGATSGAGGAGYLIYNNSVLTGGMATKTVFAGGSTTNPDMRLYALNALEIYANNALVLDYGVTTASIWTSTPAWTFTNAAIKMTAIASDTATTDTTVCLKSSDGTILKGTGTIGICLGTSNEQFKDNIRPVAEGLDEVRRLLPINYTYKPGNGHDPKKLQYGFGAWATAYVISGLVGRDEKGNPMTQDPLGLVPVITRAIVQVDDKVEALRADVAALRAEVAHIKGP